MDLLHNPHPDKLTENEHHCASESSDYSDYSDVSEDEEYEQDQEDEACQIDYHMHWLRLFFIWLVIDYSRRHASCIQQHDLRKLETVDDDNEHDSGLYISKAHGLRNKILRAVVKTGDWLEDIKKHAAIAGLNISEIKNDAGRAAHYGGMTAAINVGAPILAVAAQITGQNGQTIHDKIHHDGKAHLETIARKHEQERYEHKLEIQYLNGKPRPEPKTKPLPVVTHPTYTKPVEEQKPKTDQLPVQQPIEKVLPVKPQTTKPKLPLKDRVRKVFNTLTGHINREVTKYNTSEGRAPQVEGWFPHHDEIFQLYGHKYKARKDLPTPWDHGSNRIFFDEWGWGSFDIVTDRGATGQRESRNGWVQVSDDKDDMIRTYIKYNKEGLTLEQAQKKFRSKNPDHFRPEDNDISTKTSTPHVKPSRGWSDSFLDTINRPFSPNKEIGHIKQLSRSNRIEIGKDPINSYLPKSQLSKIPPTYIPNEPGKIHTFIDGAGYTYTWNPNKQKWMG